MRFLNHFTGPSVFFVKIKGFINYPLFSYLFEYTFTALSISLTENNPSFKRLIIHNFY
jgi:hypothetical protein